ncbi:MAG: RNA polymerase sigma factor [Nannocystales bacterium]
MVDRAPATDAELLRLWKEGDTRSGEVLFARYYDAIARFFGNKVSGDRGDLVQATFSACLEKVGGLKNAASFRSFLFGIARYELLHYYRRKSRRETEFDADKTSVYDLDPTPSRVIAKHQEQRLLLEALRHIPLDLQVVLELTYWEKLTSQEMADLLGIPEGTVKSRVRRAREKLDAQLVLLADSPDRLQTTTSDLDGWAKRLRGQLVAQQG